MQWAPYAINLTLTCLWHNSKKKTYPYIKDTRLLSLRYVDDIFTIWNGTKEQITTFINELNKKHKTIKFEYEISSQIIQFLYKMVYKDKENNLQTTLYRKPTDLQSYLYAKSEHRNGTRTHNHLVGNNFPRITNILSDILCSELIHHFREIFNVILDVSNATEGSSFGGGEREFHATCLPSNLLQN